MCWLCDHFVIVLSNWWCNVRDTDFDGNIQEGGQNFLDILNTIMGHKFHQNHPNSHIKWVKPTYATKSEFYYICLLVCVCTIDLDLVCKYMHVSSMLMLAKQLIVYWQFTLYRLSSNSLTLQILASFARYKPVWLISIISVTQYGI